MGPFALPPFPMSDHIQIAGQQPLSWTLGSWRYRIGLEEDALARLITFVNPKRTLSVSVTGSACQLDCAHCGGRYLSHMVPLSDLVAEPGRCDAEITSYLISGGCSDQGVVPVVQSLKSVRKIGPDSGRRINMHVGLISDESDAQAIGAVADVVSFDFVGDNRAIRNVYGLERSVDDYVRSYELLASQCRVVPHVCIGLDGGQPSGELSALRMIRDLGASEVVFIVFIPTPGTRFADRQPPELSYVRTVVETARSLFSDGTVQLGCMRPRGQYRSELDRMCLDLGVDSIVLPHRDTVERAHEMGLEVVWAEECCAL